MNASIFLKWYILKNDVPEMTRSITRKRKKIVQIIQKNQAVEKK